VEIQKTAAWPNIDEVSEDAHTAHPSPEQVMNAKDYAEKNRNKEARGMRNVSLAS